MLYNKILNRHLLFSMMISKAHTGYHNRKQVDRSTRSNITGKSEWIKKDPRPFGQGLCSRYLSSRAVARQVLSAHVSLTSVFGMGTGGPSQQSTRTIYLYHRCFHRRYPGDPYRIRTDVNGVRGRCLNHLTNGPLVHLHGLEPGTH